MKPDLPFNGVHMKTHTLYVFLLVVILYIYQKPFSPITINKSIKERKIYNFKKTQMKKNLESLYTGGMVKRMKCKFHALIAGFLSIGGRENERERKREAEQQREIKLREQEREQNRMNSRTRSVKAI